MYFKSGPVYGPEPGYRQRDTHAEEGEDDEEIALSVVVQDIRIYLWGIFPQVRNTGGVPAGVAAQVYRILRGRRGGEVNRYLEAADHSVMSYKLVSIHSLSFELNRSKTVCAW